MKSIRSNNHQHSQSSSFYHKTSNHHRHGNKSNNEHDDRDRDDYYDRDSNNSRSRSRSRSHSKSSSSYSEHSQVYSASAKKSNNHNSNSSSNVRSAHHYQSPAHQKNSSLNNSNGNGSLFAVERRFNPGPPSRTIMLRQIPLQMDDNELRKEFDLLNVPYKDIRLVKNRESGYSRGFAFLEFGAIEEAQAWMNTTQGWLVFSNYDSKIQLFYSHSSADESNSISSSGSIGGKKSNQLPSDWDCSKCGIKNFKRRDKCFKCGITREESDRRRDGDGYDFVGATPCNTLILRGLDALTTSETIIKILNKHSNSTLPIKNCHIAKDLHTNVSNGFAFVEMTSIQDAGFMLQLMTPNFEIDGKQITINYCKNSFKTALSQLENHSRMAYENMNNTMNNEPIGPYTHNTHINNKTNQADQANSAAAVAQAAMQSMHKKQELLSHLTSTLTAQPQNPNSIDIDSSVGTNLQMLAKQVDMIANKVYPPPDITQFSYDETSGYYYDYSTGFYYDATSQYYFNSLTQQYMYWDSLQSTYVPVTSGTTESANDSLISAAASSTTTTSTATTNNNFIKVDEVKSNEPAKVAKTATTNKVKTAAQIAKEMERWAKEQSMKKKDTPAPKKPVSVTSSHADVKHPTPQLGAHGSGGPGFTEIIHAPSVLSKPSEINVPPVASADNESSYSKKTSANPEPQSMETATSDSDNSNDKAIATTQAADQGIIDESSLIDTSKMACLLCKRKFDSLDILNKHVAKSDLHKTNLEKLRQENIKKSPESTTAAPETKSSSTASVETDSLLAALQYRDRAKERRKKYGTPEPPSPNYSSIKSSSYQADYTQSTAVGSIIEKNRDSVATKLMRKMGWEGSGIGKNLQGISTPIEATMRQKGAGLGASNVEIDPNDSYQVAARKIARARYEKL